ncbi:hypothetical protein ACTQYZ_04775 [Anaerofustis sp. LCP19S3_F7]
MDKITSVDKDTIVKLENAIADGADISVDVVIDKKIMFHMMKKS